MKKRNGTYINYLIRLIIALLAFGLFSGCYSTAIIRPYQKSDSLRERIVDKNYIIGQQSDTYIGKPVIKVKDYYVDRQTGFMQASDDFSISSGLVTIVGYKDKAYKIEGITSVNDVDYIILRTTYGSPPMVYRLLINSEGEVYSKLMYQDAIMLGSNAIAKPTDLHFYERIEENIDLNAGYMNYELIYGGTDGESITMTYREYTIDNLARPAFYQNVTYEAGKEQIRFKDTIIKIHEATNEKIVFTVIADGLNK